MIRLKLLILPFALLLTLNAFTQVSIKLDSLTGIPVNGSVLHFEGNELPLSAHMYDFYVVNNTGFAQDFIITRRLVSEPTGFLNYICWDMCYNPSSLILWSSGSSNIWNGQSKFFSTYVISTIQGSAHYRYYVSNDGFNFIDSVDVVVSTLYVGIPERNKSKYKVFPNPAKNSITISRNTNSSNQLKILDSLGKLVLSSTLSNKESKINLSQLKPGYYFYTIIDSENGEVISNRLIIE